MREKVSVIIPAYNRANYLQRAINSVLKQTLKPYEIIVVDDGSTDNTKEVVNSFGRKVRYSYQENRGPSAARNLGMKQAKGDYIAFLDSDDEWAETKIEKQIKLLRSNKKLSLVFTDMQDLKEDRSIINESLLHRCICFDELKSRRESGDIVDLLIVENFISTPSVLFKKECLKTVGLFDESLRLAEDKEFFIRFALSFGLGFIDEILVFRFIHESNEIHKKMGMLKANEDIIKKLEFMISKHKLKRLKKPLDKYRNKIYTYIGIEYLKEWKIAKSMKYFKKVNMKRVPFLVYILTKNFIIKK